jgi:prepilin-type processing-associated H-X9-DG protein
MMTRRSYQGRVFGILLASGLLALLVAGCSGGEEEPPPAPDNAGSRKQDGKPIQTGSTDSQPANPASEKTEPDPGKDAAAIRKSQEKLALIGKGLVANGYPAGFCDLKGKPLLSWRVALLPLLGYPELFARFKLDEAWDGPTNRKLIAEMPDIFKPVRGTVPEGHTFYQGFVGEEAMFPPRGPDNVPRAEFNGFHCVFIAARQPTDVQDGTAKTFLVVEAGKAVPWTNPGDLPYDPKKPLPALGGLSGGDFNACFCDGSVRLVPRGIAEKTLRALITPAGSEKIDLSAAGVSEPYQGGPKP